MNAYLALAERYAPTFVDAAWRGALILVLALVVSHLLRHRPAAARHMVWTIAVAAQLLLPAYARWGPRWDVAVPAAAAAVLSLPTRVSSAPPAVADTRNDAPLGSQVGLSPAASDSVRVPAAGEREAVTSDVVASGSTMPSTATPDAASSAKADTRFALVAWLWLAGATAVLLRLAVGTIAVAGFARRGTRVEDGEWLSLMQRLTTTLRIARPLTLLRGNRLGVPVTWGILYPVVMLPDDADRWPDDRRRFVLVHEMAHVKRLDALTQMAGQLALALFWFNPLVWIANRRMQLEREHACDDYVLRHGTAPSQYAEELLSMVRELGTPSHRSTQPAFAALAMARRSEFEGRMLSILDPRLPRYAIRRGHALMGTFAALAVMVPLAALEPYREIAPPFNPNASVQITAESAPVAPAPVVSRGPATAPATSPPAVSPTAIADPAMEAAGVAAACDGPSFGRAGITGTHVRTNDGDPGAARISIVQTSASRCISALIDGRVTYADDESDIVRMSSSAIARFRERTASSDRQLTLLPRSDGTIERRYQVDGDDRPFDSGARHWLASLLPTLLADAGINAGPRVARWQAERGVRGALARIGELRSPGSKRAHYEAMLQSRTLSGPDLDEIVRHAGGELDSNPGDLRAVLSRAAPTSRASGATMRSSPAVESAIQNISSSGDRTAVLQLYGANGDRDMLLMVARIARDIESSGDLARLLISLAERYHLSDDSRLYEAFYTTARTIPSAGDLRNVLIAAVPLAVRSTGQTLALIHSSRDIPSSGDRASVLISLAESGGLRNRDIRDAFMEAAAGIPSDGDRSRVLRAAARQ